MFFPSLFGVTAVFIAFGSVFWLPVALLANPLSRKILVAWCLLLAACVALFCWHFVTPSGPSRFSHIPLLADLAHLVLLICVPFGTSFLLWRVQRQRSLPIPDGWLFVVILICTVAGGTALKALNETCIYYPYHHRDGKAWCPVSWQARETG